MHRKRGFTLVELLVVIGIIAVLVGILLPALNSARKQAELVKCASCLREIGNANAMYVNENKGWEVPAKTLGYYTISYTNTMPPVTDYGPQFWYQFLAKYVTRAQMGTASGNNTKTQLEQTQEALASVFWGCPAFAKYVSGGTVGGFNVTQPGYGFNAWPEYTASYPPIVTGNVGQAIGDAGVTATGLDGNAVSIINCANGQVNNPGIQDWRRITAGRWYKFGQYTNPSERALVADSQFWSLESLSVNPTPPVVIPGQKFYDPNNTWYPSAAGAFGQTTADAYRHGKFPPVATVGSVGKYQPVGGKVSMNMLFCDGHVSTLVDRGAIFKATRMRFPG